MADVTDDFDGRRASPIKRIRQACLTCRRKKSRCGGEKPVCSICRRLEQDCVYDTPRNRDRGAGVSRNVTREGDEFSRRFGTIEQKLEYLAATVEYLVLFAFDFFLVDLGDRKAVPGSSRRASSQGHSGNDRRSLDLSSQSLHFLPAISHNDSPRVLENYIEKTTHDLRGDANFGSLTLESLPQDIIQDAVEAYFKCFHAQPYALFSAESAAHHSRSLDPIIIYPMLALTVRCSSHPFWSNGLKVLTAIRTFSEKAWQTLLQLYGKGAANLEYLQGLCLLAQVDFADGRVRRAHTQISLGIRIVQSAGYLVEENSPGLSEDCRRCVWTLFMLDRTFSASQTVTPALHYDYFQLPLPLSDESLLLVQQRRGSIYSIHPEAEPAEGDIGISALNVKVFSIWNDVLQYVFRPSSKSAAPPWQSGSDLAEIESQFTDFEPEFSCHRYHRAGFPRRAQDDPASHSYFTAWLCFQLLYMSIQCVVHHPFIMFIKMQPLIRKVPPSFLQKSYKSSLIHSRWIIRLIDEMDQAGLMLYDPFIGYLIAIAATIQLEHTVSKHSDVSAAATLSFKGALRYLRKLCKYWKSIENLLGIVEELAARVRSRPTIYYSQDDYNGALPSIESQRVQLASGDIELMWRLFDYASISGEEAAMQTEGRAEEAKQLSTFHSGMRQAAAEESSNRSGSDGHQERVNVNELHHPSDIIPLSPGSRGTLFDPAILSDLPPEEWILDDWTLFGAPWSAYQSGLDP